jgi:hypothetical protein
MVIFAMLLLGFMGLAALVIDLGLARVTQDQMQTAADASALASMRESTDTAIHDTAQAYVTGTGLPGTPPAAFVDPSGETIMGEGPSLATNAGINVLHASEQIDTTVQPPGVYRPGALQLNPGNAPNGDIVSGAYTFDSATPLDQLEAQDYLRTDFTAGAGGGAVLVRLRRVNSILGASNPADNTLGVSSSGPAVPFMFGHGAFIHGTDPNETTTAYSPLRDGIALRATSIAALRTATAVGWSTATQPLGADQAQWAVPYASWQNVAATPTMGALTYTFQDPNVTIPLAGARLALAASLTTPPSGAGPFYVVLYDQQVVGGVTTTFVAGFGYATVTGTAGSNVTLAPATGPFDNATASVYDGFAWAGANAAQLEAFVATDFSSSAAPLVQAPALVR